MRLTALRGQKSAINPILPGLAEGGHAELSHGAIPYKMLGIRKRAGAEIANKYSMAYRGPEVLYNGTFEYSGVTFDGVGLNDMTVGSTYDGVGHTSYIVEIIGIVDDDWGGGEWGEMGWGSYVAPDTNVFRWTDDNEETWSAPTAMTGAAQDISNRLTITFGATTGHTVGDRSTFSRVWAINAIGGASGSQNVGTTYSHYSGDTARNHSLQIIHTGGTPGYLKIQHWVDISDRSAQDEAYWLRAWVYFDADCPASTIVTLQTRGFADNVSVMMDAEDAFGPGHVAGGFGTGAWGLFAWGGVAWGGGGWTRIEKRFVPLASDTTGYIEMIVNNGGAGTNAIAYLDDISFAPEVGVTGIARFTAKAVLDWAARVTTYPSDGTGPPEHLIKNWNFEERGGWEAVCDEPGHVYIFAYTMAQRYDGDWSGLLHCLPSSLRIRQRVSLEAGTEYHFTAWVLIPGGPLSPDYGAFSLTDFDEDTHESVADLTGHLNEWQPLTFTITPTESGDGWVNIHVTGGSLYVDCVTTTVSPIVVTKNVKNIKMTFPDTDMVFDARAPSFAVYEKGTLTAFRVRKDLEGNYSLCSAIVGDETPETHWVQLWEPGTVEIKDATHGGSEQDSGEHTGQVGAITANKLYWSLQPSTPRSFIQIGAPPAEHYVKTDSFKSILHIGRKFWILASAEPDHAGDPGVYRPALLTWSPDTSGWETAHVFTDSVNETVICKGGSDITFVLGGNNKLFVYTGKTAGNKPELWWIDVTSDMWTNGPGSTWTPGNKDQSLCPTIGIQDGFYGLYATSEGVLFEWFRHPNDTAYREYRPDRIGEEWGEDGTGKKALKYGSLSEFPGEPWWWPEEEQTITIQGLVTRDDTGAGIPQVCINFPLGEAPFLRTAETNAIGQYSIELPSGYTGIATPYFLGSGLGTWAPASRDYSEQTDSLLWEVGGANNQDYVWTPPGMPPVTYNISGTVTDYDSGDPVENVKIVFSNAGSATTDVLGQYNIDVIEGYYGAGVPEYVGKGAEVAYEGATFSPAKIGYSNVQVDQTEQDYKIIAPKNDYPYHVFPTPALASTSRYGVVTIVTTSDGKMRAALGYDFPRFRDLWDLTDTRKLLEGKVILNGLSMFTWPIFVLFNGWLYVFTGVQSPVRTDGIRVYWCGANAPRIAPKVAVGALVASGPSGKYTVVYTYYDSTLGVESDPSPYSELITVGANYGIDVSGLIPPFEENSGLIPTPSRFDKIRIYRTQDLDTIGSTSVLYHETEIDVHETTVTLTDTDIELGESTTLDTQPRGPLPALMYAVAHKRRLWMTSAYEQRWGSVRTTKGIAHVIGVGTYWSQGLRGAYIVINNIRYEIDYVTTSQDLYLTRVFDQEGGEYNYLITFDENAVYPTRLSMEYGAPQPESVDRENPVMVAVNDGDRTIGISIQGGFIYAHKYKSIHRVLERMDGFDVMATHAVCGGLHRTICPDSRGNLLYYSPLKPGIWALNGEESKELTVEVRDWFDNVDHTYDLDAHAVYHPTWQRYFLFLSQHSRLDTVIVYGDSVLDVTGTGFWGRHHEIEDYSGGVVPMIGCSAILNDPGEKPHMYVGDGAGRVFELGVGTDDADLGQTQYPIDDDAEMMFRWKSLPLRAPEIGKTLHPQAAAWRVAIVGKQNSGTLTVNVYKDFSTTVTKTKEFDITTEPVASYDFKIRGKFIQIELVQSTPGVTVDIMEIACLLTSHPER